MRSTGLLFVHSHRFPLDLYPSVACMALEPALRLLSSGPKDRLTGVDHIAAYVQSNKLTRDECALLCDAYPQLLGDNNAKVAQTALKSLGSLVTPEHQLIQNVLPAVAERLGDTKQVLRQEACNLLVSALQVYGNTILDKFTKQWRHRNWKVRHGMLQFLAEAMAQHEVNYLQYSTSEGDLYLQVMQLLDDPESPVREAAMECLEEAAKLVGEELYDILNQQSLRPSIRRVIDERLKDLIPQRPSSSSQPAQKMMPKPGSAPTASGKLPPTNMDVAANRGCAGSSEAMESGPGPTNKGALSAGQKRRGGYKDGGGLGVSGELPEAAAVRVANEKELKGEMEAIQLQLEPSIQWDKRIEAMVRLEGLLKGAGGAYETVPEYLKPLRDVLVQQILDRRSAVSRQVCHLLGVAAMTMGNRFEPLALALIPELMKVLPITVLIMAQAADRSIRTILQHCQSDRLLARVIEGATKDKNPKLRSFCSQYVLLVLERWDPQVYLRMTDAVEHAIRFGAQDSLADARQAGKQAFAAYAAQVPDKAAAFLKRMDSSLQEKLQQACSQYQPPSGAPGVTAALAVLALSQPTSTSSRLTRPDLSALRAAKAANSSSGIDILVQAPPPPPKSQPLSSRTAGKYDSDSSIERGALTSRDGRFKRKQVAGTAVRIPDGVLDQQGGDQMENLEQKKPAGPHNPGILAQRKAGPLAGGSVNTPTGGGMHHPLRVLSHTGIPSPAIRHLILDGGTAVTPGPHSSGTVPELPVLETDGIHKASKAHLQKTSSDDLNGGVVKDQVAAQQARGPVAVSRVVANIGPNLKTWTDKVEGCTTLREALQATISAKDGMELLQDIERLPPKLLFLLEDPHFKVTLAVLDVAATAIKVCSRGFETSMEKFMPAVFIKLIDQKETVRALAQEVLQVCAATMQADALMGPLLKSLESMKVSKGKAAVLEFSTLFLGKGRPAGVPTNITIIRQWISKVVGLLSDKNSDIRKFATMALENVYQNMDPGLVMDHMSKCGGADMLAMRRALSSVRQDDEGPSSSPSSPPVPSSARDVRKAVHPHMQQLKGSSIPESQGAVGPVAGELNPGGTRGKGRSPTVVRPRSSPTRGPPEYNSSKVPVPSAPSCPTSQLTQDTTATTAAAAGPSRQDTGYISPIPYASGNPYIRPLQSPAPSPIIPRDPMVQARQLALLTHKLQSSPTEEVLLSLSDYVTTFSPAVWATNFSQLIMAVLHSCKDDQDVVRELSFSLMRDLAGAHPGLLEPLLDVMLHNLLVGCADPSREVATVASQAIDELVDHTNPSRCASMLQVKLPNADSLQNGTACDNEQLVACIRGLQRLVKKMAPQELATRAPSDLLPGLFHAFNHTRPDVRKAVTFCIVDMWCILGEWLTPYLSSLSTPQLKLLTIYFNRAQEQKARMTLACDGQGVTSY